MDLTIQFKTCVSHGSAMAEELSYVLKCSKQSLMYDFNRNMYPSASRNSAWIWKHDYVNIPEILYCICTNERSK